MEINGCTYLVTESREEWKKKKSPPAIVTVSTILRMHRRVDWEPISHSDQ